MERKTNSLKSISQSGVRHHQEYLRVGAAELEAWAAENGLSLRQATEMALQEGIFPELWDRNFPALTAAEQLKLFQSSALVVGLGGLGGNIATLLARVGVGRLLLADGDVFAPSNLNRQLLATRSTLGQNKALVTARHLLNITPALEVEPIPRFLDGELLRVYLTQVQVVLDGLDSVKVRREMFAAAREVGVPLIHAAVHGHFGQVATVMPDSDIQFHQIYHPEAPESEAIRDVLAPVVSLAASLQVQEAMRILLGQPPAYAGRLAYFDGETGRLEVISLAG
ncbi:MAG: HesA/MoeB/ThiF family protein [Deltaproteobacteria bacterium]|nr:HesA/MoeB/ThiF family protein [Deltaproteobacteria bacterium]